MSLKQYTGFTRLTERLHDAIINGKISHAYILEGDTGIDKEAFAKDFVKAILCREEPGYGCDHCRICRKIEHGNYEDMYMVKADDSSLKDAVISGLQADLKNKPAGGDRNIAIICDADTMTVRAQNRLLKTLEEPNAGTVILLLSENTENLLPTILSRCIVLRLGNYTRSLQNQAEEQSFAKELMEIIESGAYFCEIKDKLTKEIKDRKEAFALLDGLERLFRDRLLGGSTGSLRKEQIIRNIAYVEAARRDLLANVNYKYAIRNLVLKIGG